MTDYIDTQKTYKQKAEAQIEKLEAELKKAKANAKEAAADKKLELDKKLEKIESDLKQTKGKLGQLMDTAQEKWEMTTGSLNKKIKKIQNQFDELGSHLSLD